MAAPAEITLKDLSGEWVMVSNTVLHHLVLAPPSLQQPISQPISHSISQYFNMLTQLAEQNPVR